MNTFWSTLFSVLLSSAVCAQKEVPGEDPGELRLSVPAAVQQGITLDEKAAGPAQRIWAATTFDRQDLWFRRRLQLKHALKSATLVISCDNRFTVHANGIEVGAGEDWEKLTVVDVTTAFAAGDNLLAVHARNEGSCAALAVWFYWEDTSGARGQLVSDAEWKVHEDEVEGWASPKFDDGQWVAATAQGATPFARNVYGGAPRGLVFRAPFAESADAVARATEALRRARDPEAAERALAAIERAVIEARAALWKVRDAEAAKKRADKR